MEDSLQTPTPIDPSDPKYDPHILDYLQLMLKYKKAVLFIVAFFGIGALVLTYMVPQEFESDSLILPPDRLSSYSLLSKYNAGFALEMLKEVENPSVDVLQNLAESRLMGSSLLADSAIAQYFRSKGYSREEMQEKVHSAVLFTPGFTQVSVKGICETGWFPNSKEKEQARILCAHIANRTVEIMDSIIRADVRSLAHSTRVYADSDYASRVRELDSLAAIQEQIEKQYGIVKLSAQTQEAITRMAALKATRDEADIRLRILRLDMADNAASPQAIAAVATEANRASEAYAAEPQIGPALDSLPAINRGYANVLQREKELEPIVAFLRGEIEQQRIFEEREKSPISVIDTAVPPNGRSSPKRVPMLALGVIIGFVISVLYIAVRALQTDSKRRARLAV